MLSPGAKCPTFKDGR